MKAAYAGSSRRLVVTHLPAVDRALDLLEILAHTSCGLTLSEASQKLGIPISSAYYLVQTLLARGYVQRGTDGHHYNLGPRAFDFANLSLEELELRKISSPHTERLGRELKLTAQTAVRKGTQAVIIDKWDFHGAYGGVWVGVHFYLHASALGKAIIAYLSDVELEMLYRGRSLIKLTPNTICSFEALKAHLAEVRAKGFAVNNEEDCFGRRTIAAPIFNHVGYVIASVCVQGLTAQIPDWQIPKLADRVICAAREISRDLAPQG